MYSLASGSNSLNYEYTFHSRTFLLFAKPPLPFSLSTLPTTLQFTVSILNVTKSAIHSKIV